MKTFGLWLLEELAKRDMSQSDLARACNITTAQISRIISGERNASTKSLTSIAQALKLPVDLVFEKAGLLPANSELSPLQRKIMDIVKQLPDSGHQALFLFLEGWTGEENVEDMVIIMDDKGEFTIA